VTEALFTVEQVAHAVRGEPVAGLGRQPVAAVSIDSRTATPGSLFVPMAGSRVDGHDYLGDAFQAGAAAALVGRRFWSAKSSEIGPLVARAGASIVVVEDTLRALQALAAWHLRRLGGLTAVGVTGSNGKTTTKELLGAVLGRARPTAVSPGNLNSETGLPLSCFLVRPGTEIAVFEMAMNHLGEIADLTDIVRPSLALITNIGMAHIGFCGSQEAIALEKKAIFSRFTGRETAFLPRGDRFYDLLARDVRGRIVPFGPGATRGFEKSEDRGLDGSVIVWEGLRIRLPLVGRHNVSNALAAISVAVELGVAPAQVRDGLESARPLAGRSEIIRGRVTIVADCYNSSPDSARELLTLLGELPRAERRIGVFGSMLELGHESVAAHARLGAAVAAAGFDELCFFGADAREAWTAAVRALPGRAAPAWTESHDELGRWLERTVRPGDLVVLKGSRGMELERAIARLADTRVTACS
jgi:UDP-N-acetylmuramoyl-tripeptide--D-alanyl-D-alanine ligase